MAECHPDRRHYGRGMCGACYQIWFRQQKPRYFRDWERAHRDPRGERAKKLLNHYGITIEEYESLLALQGGRCAICRRLSFDTQWRSLAVDHDHATGEIRGLLCHLCNRVLGLADDDPARLRRAAEYLEWARRFSKTSK